MRIARTMETYDFEPRGSDPASRDRDADGWPDYWVLVKDDKHKDYMAKSIRIVEDDQRPGLWRGRPGHVLRIPFDGTPVALRTLYPRAIDPGMAYEVTVWWRARDLFHPRRDGRPTTRVRVRLVWLYVEPKFERMIGQPFVIELDAGQVDWPETPVTRRINNLPVDPESGLRPNAVRLILEVEDNPRLPGADRHGTVWFDDISIRSRPKLRAAPVLLTAPAGMEQGRKPAKPVMVNLQVEAMGLVDNVPRPGPPGGFEGKDYSLRLHVTDIDGAPPLDSRGAPLRYDLRLRPGTKRKVTQTLAVPLHKLGVHYLTFELRGHVRELLAELTQVIVLRPPARPASRPRVFARRQASGFGTSLAALPLALLERDSNPLAAEIARLGARWVKVHAWSTRFKAGEQEHPDLVALARGLREIRGLGAQVTAVIPNTTAPLSGLGMARLMQERPGLLRAYLQAASPYLRPHVESWQWGVDDDTSFNALADSASLRRCRRALGDMAATTIQALPVNLGLPKPALPAPGDVALNLFVPADMERGRMLLRLATLLPRHFARLLRKHLYPPRYLRDLVPATIDGEPVSPGRELPLKRRAWISLQLPAAPAMERRARPERLQAQDLAGKAILARALGFPRVFLGRLLDAKRGLLLPGPGGRPIPRAAALAAATLQRYLGDADYIGSLQLRDEFPNFVFRLPGRELDAVVIGLWYDGPGEQGELPRLYLGDLPLQVVDLAGNLRPLPAHAPLRVSKSPVLITGMSASLALTRMSMKIEEEPPLRAEHELQRQLVSVTNYCKTQLLVTVKALYAADQERFRRERGWTVRPDRVKLDLSAPREHRPLPRGVLRFQVRPDPQSHIGTAAGAGTDGGRVWPPPPGPGKRPARFGRKYVLLDTRISSIRAVRMQVLRKTRLRSDLEVKVFRLRKPDPRRIYLQMQIRWLPGNRAGARRELLLRPYYLKRGRLPTRLPLASVPAHGPGDTRAATMVEFPIPRRPRARTLIGLEEEGGSRFFILDVTALLATARE